MDLVVVSPTLDVVVVSDTPCVVVVDTVAFVVVMNGVVAVVEVEALIFDNKWLVNIKKKDCKQWKCKFTSLKIF